MTYKEIIKERKELEKAIHSLISEYERKTGFHVSSVNLDHMKFNELTACGDLREITTNVIVYVRL